MKYFPLISLIISVIALIVSIYSLYLQRRAKKPLLRITARRDLLSLPLQNTGGSPLYGNKEVIILEMRNPTEREINIQKVEFFSNNKILLVNPYTKVEKVSSHGQSQIIVTDDLRDGYFIVSDALGHQFMSNRI